MTASRTTARGTAGPRDPTDDPEVTALRARQRRNMMTTLLLSQGVPMILGGDELGRTQQGNNNAYCQDSELSWYDWEHVDGEFTDWCRMLTTLRKAHPVFRRRRWFQGHPIRGTEEVYWVRPDGELMSDHDWANGYARSVGVLLNGGAISTPDAYGGRVVDDSFLVLFNASEIDLPWQLPAAAWPEPWTVELDSGLALEPGTPLAADATVPLVERSVVVLRSAPMTPPAPVDNACRRSPARSRAKRADPPASA